MTSAKDLQALYDYCYWANEKLLGAVEMLAPEQFTEPLAGAYGSIRNTLVHMLSAEWGWLERCGGQKRGPALVPEDYPTVAIWIDRWKTVEVFVREFLSSLTDDDLTRPVTFALGGGPEESLALGELLHHGAVHGIHHRGQAALLLRALGRAPGNFDILLFYRQKHMAG